ncbi:MAG: prepilin-type N-terminal cleavage/methylation domain-containing protein [Bacillota bacterium]|jgi:prepilin-type N-terminal cleavage/methylation domain-containing protein|nr:prepilin-type N-terminal cleavage/methylation domain-containing protein [Bacillota bacterium]
MKVQDGLKKVFGQEGFTLAEVLATLAILSLVVTCTTMILGQSLGIWQTTSAQSFSHLGAELGLHYLARDLRLATAIVVPNDDDPSHNFLKLKRGTREIEYSLENSTLTRSVNGIKTAVVDDLKDFSVQKISRRTYSISITARVEAEEFQLTSQVSPRTAN